MPSSKVQDGYSGLCVCGHTIAVHQLGMHIGGCVGTMECRCSAYYDLGTWLHKLLQQVSMLSLLHENLDELD